MSSYEIKVNSAGGISFGTLCWATWIIFMILYYGTGTIAHWPIFWIWFPFWLPFAVSIAFGIIGLICALILAAFDE